MRNQKVLLHLSNKTITIKTKHYDSKIFPAKKIPIHFLYSGSSLVYFTIYKSITL